MGTDVLSRFVAGAILVAAALAGRPAFASHSHQVFDDTGPFGNTSTILFVMDALPAGQDPFFATQPRTVVL